MASPVPLQTESQECPSTVLGGLEPSERCERALLDLPAAERWFRLLRFGRQEDLYTCQQPLESRTGPRIRIRGRPYLSLSSYDYLGLIGHPEVEEAAIAAIRRYGPGSGGVRLLTGTNELHCALERELARFVGSEAALVLGSGYAANLAVVPALVGPRDVIIADALAHRSLLDAARLSRARLRRCRHNDPAALDQALAEEAATPRRLVMVDGVYSMEGDIAPLPDILAVCRRHRAFLLVDEAHALGTIGPAGRGTAAHFGIDPGEVDVWTGSLSKALGAQGGYVAGSARLITYLQHEGAPYIFSGALCPASTAAALEGLSVIRREPLRLERMRLRAVQLRSGLRRSGHTVSEWPTPIVPLLVGDEMEAYRLARRLFAAGVLATAVTHPAVPAGQARLRLCATAAHSARDISEGGAAIATWSRA